VQPNDKENPSFLSVSPEKFLEIIEKFKAGDRELNEDQKKSLDELKDFFNEKKVKRECSWSKLPVSLFCYKVRLLMKYFLCILMKILTARRSLKAMKVNLSATIELIPSGWGKQWEWLLA
jgi:hypothetical protein